MAKGIFNLKQVNRAIRQGAWSAFNPPQFVEYLVVAGGGGGGGLGGNGAGAGGLLTGIVPVAAGASYTVTVGAGGTTNTNGVNSVFSTITAFGGGGGASTSPDPATPQNGGSGAGGSYLGTAPIVGQGVVGQGNAGGIAKYYGSPYASGGGGGAGTVGLAIDSTSTYSGAGGAGIASAISGTVAVYAGGGGGGGTPNGAVGGAGGVGGGGFGQSTGGTSAGDGTVNTGGGGGGRSSGGGGTGLGGSGIVIVRYSGTVQFYTGGTVGYANGYIIHTFYANGTLAPTTPTQYSNTYQISRSLRFNSADSPYLNRTPASAGNRRTWTWSGWVKRTAFGANGNLFFTGTSYTETTAMGISFSTGGGNDTDCLNITTGAQVFRRSTNQLRDPSAWYHLVVAFDTTQSNATDRVKMYVNNVLITSFVLSNNPVQNTEYGINQAAVHWIGGDSVIASTYLNGYMADVHFIDGQQLTPSSFGEYDVNTGVWIPRSYGGSYGTNGFKLNFSDNSNVTAATLGADTSGNGNNWTPNNFSVTAGVTNDSFVDTPTPYGTDTGVGGEVRGNYCTLNRLDVAGTPTISEGNLKIVNTNADAVVRGTFGIPGNSGKWYWEFTQQTAIGTAGQSPIVYGMATLQSKVSHTVAVIRKAAYYYTDYLGRYLLVYVNGATAATISVATAIAINEVLQFAYDSDTGKVWIGKSGVWSDSSGGTTGNPATGANATYTFASVDEPMTPTFDHAGVDFTATLNCGQRAFVNTAPTGFKALSTTNLPTPTIGATAATQANKFFNAVTYTGTGATRQVGVGFQPDWVWIKSRSATTDHGLYDAVRGVQKQIESNTTTAETTETTGITAFDSGGFTTGALAQLNTSAATYVAWNWKAGGTGVTNTAGSITSTVSANPTAGFSIVSYTGTGANATIGHGLGAVPSVIIVKNLTQAGNYFAVYTSMVGNTKTLWLSSTDAEVTSSQYWNNTTPTSSVFSVGSAGPMNGSTHSMLAYCFAPIAGYSAFEKYTGNGSTDGPFAFTGFRPRFILWKNSTSVYDWQIVDTARDTYNASGIVLQPNATNAEADGRPQLDILSNGFKIRASSSVTNESASTFIYMAFAENPFKYSLAR